MTKIIFLNGPARSGKDTSAEILQQYAGSVWQDFGTSEPGSNGKYLYHVEHMKFSAPIKRAFAGLVGARMDDRFCVEPFESRKEEPIEALGVSYRQWQIDFSEHLMKPLYGEAIFGNLALMEIAAAEKRAELLKCELVAIFSDCGFQIEVDTVFFQFPPRDRLLLRLHRPGFDFIGDSRGYVTDCAPQEHDIQNTGTTLELEAKLLAVVRPFLEPKTPG